MTAQRHRTSQMQEIQNGSERTTTSNATHRHTTAATRVTTQRHRTAQMQEILKATGQTGMPEVKPILEINPDHEIIKKLAAMRKSKSFDDGVLLLYEQALLQEGVNLDNPAGFVKRINKLMEKAL